MTIELNGSQIRHTSETDGGKYKYIETLLKIRDAIQFIVKPIGIPRSVIDAASLAASDEILKYMKDK